MDPKTKRTKTTAAVYDEDYEILRARADKGVSLAEIIHAALVAAGWVTDDQ